MDELELTPDLEAQILIRAHELGLSTERLRYYTQYGPTAPDARQFNVKPPSLWQRLLRR